LALTPFFLRLMYALRRFRFSPLLYCLLIIVFNSRKLFRLFAAL
jgi:hypothetical protein